MRRRFRGSSLFWDVEIGGESIFQGDLNAAGGTFGGTLSAADGTFTGDLTAAGGTFNGTLSAVDGTFAGTLDAVDGTFTGTVSGGAIDIGGADATSFHVDTSGQMWMGAAAYASAPFKVSAAGAVVASSYTLTGGGGMTIDSSTGKITAPNLDGAGQIVSGGQLSSDVYTSGSVGWAIDGDGNVEFNDGTFRGSIVADSFQTDGVGAWIAVGPSPGETDLDAFRFIAGLTTAGTFSETLSGGGSATKIVYLAGHGEAGLTAGSGAFLDVSTDGPWIAAISEYTISGWVKNSSSLVLTADTIDIGDYSQFYSEGLKVERLPNNTLNPYSGWTDYGAGYAGWRYHKDANGFVHLSGLVRNTSGSTKAAGSAMILLGAGYQPAMDQIFVAEYSTGPARLDVKSNGQIVNAGAAIVNNGWVSVSGISFYAGW